MKIISKFKDYYDFVAGHDEDPRKVFNRDMQIYNPPISLFKNKDNHPIFHTIDRHAYDLGEDKAVDFFIGAVWFCDEFYQYVKSGSRFYYDYYHIPEMTRVAINRRLYVKYSHTMRAGVDLERIFRIKKLSSWDRMRDGLLEKPMNTLYGQPIIFSRKRDGIFVETIINGNLKELEFSQVKKPTEAFTDLYNWIPYIEPKMPDDPTDLIRYEGKGFDKKTSFRHPTK